MESALIQDFLVYIASVRRYSLRTQALYRDSLTRFLQFSLPVSEGNRPAQTPDSPDSHLLKALTPKTVRRYEVMLMNEGISPRTINLHLSALSSFCKYLIKEGKLNTNPVKLVKKPKTAKRLPEFYKEADLETYFRATDFFVYDPTVLDSATEQTSPETIIEAYINSKGHGFREAEDDDLMQMRALAEKPEKFREWIYGKKLERAVIATFYSTGIRRAELIGLARESVDSSRMILKVKGKGDKNREIPIIPSLYQEISLYLQTVEAMSVCGQSAKTPLFVTYTGRPLYPALVDRLVKEGLGTETGITGKKSPHVLRHTVATGLLDSGADLNSIKEFLGHSSLAATQVYTHNSIAKLKNVYLTAHPRAKNGGKHGD